MKCDICNANDANHLWQPFGPSPSVDSFLPLDQQNHAFPVVPVCTPCRGCIQQRQETLQFTYRRFAYQVSDGQVKLLPDQKLASRAVRKAELVGDPIVHVEACVSLAQDGSLIVPEVIVTLASQRRLRYSTKNEGFSLSLPIKYCRWDNKQAEAGK